MSQTVPVRNSNANLLSYLPHPAATWGVPATLATPPFVCPMHAVSQVTWVSNMCFWNRHPTPSSSRVMRSHACAHVGDSLRETPPLVDRRGTPCVAPVDYELLGTYCDPLLCPNSHKNAAFGQRAVASHTCNIRWYYHVYYVCPFGVRYAYY